MAMVDYSTSQLSLPHKQLVELHKQGKVNLGMSEEFALRLATSGIHPKGSTRHAFKFFTGLAWVVAGVGLYWAFTSAWWWGVLGLIGMVVILNGNKSGHAQNLMYAALGDESFYERVRELNGWRYQIDEDAAADFLR
ncbi:hypothetical protein LGH82_02565 [Mesorhizobium sp. PAMC28654]|uniref:hypothetical protein n=1 Tax=Mesorhizobium sp. PAMC28654 TaxID=2880934 RepID=UPI001D0A65FE|nr:hypothetical protein [Mesorhizobium sp. PAMC28654]UDL90287.1 hypothetical protein LGH82_02565 [Mesorhizobium sp. PAMC28654]